MGALTDKYCIVGVGETPHMRPSNRTTLSMACEAVKKAMADAGLEPRDIDGMTSYQAGDSTSSNHVSTALGIRLNYSLDIRRQWVADRAHLIEQADARWPALARTVH